MAPALAAFAKGRPVRMPSTPVPEPEYRQFQRHLLKLALRKAGWSDALDILPTQTWMRQVRELREGHVDVAPLPALQAEIYQQFGLLRVDHPLRGGLLGVRRLVVLRDRLPVFQAIKDLASLKRDFVLGYGSDWGDRAELQRLGFRMALAAPSTSNEPLYALLRKGEADYLSRGLNEVVSELLRHGKGAPLAAVPGLVLHYPLDDCFFVSPQRRDLHEALTQGLSRALADGSHAALVRQHYEDELAQLAGAQAWRVEGYPAPPGLEPKRFEGWRPALQAAAPSAQAASRPPRVERPRLVLAVGLNPEDERARFAEALVQMALAHAQLDMDVAVHEGLDTARRAGALQLGRIDIGQLPMLEPPKAEQALPVRFPIRRGLLGVRLLVARSARAADIAAVRTFGELQSRFQLGHGARWADLPLLRKAGLQVRPVASLQDVYKGLRAGSFDFASRGLNEVWDELDDPQLGGLSGPGGLVVVPGVALRYPLDDLLWVSARRPELQQVLERGLDEAQRKGAYQALFSRFFGAAIRRAALSGRRVWTLPGIEAPLGLPAAAFDAAQRVLAPVPAASGA
ncbi:hypothetical protein [Inhella sp.]|uniref:hypothetical protein n=1 Tax=Inhella sp. TaxID=1921806 RepID=UPI0035B3038B